jgi:periplasmic protein TonB
MDGSLGYGLIISALLHGAVLGGICGGLVIPPRFLAGGGGQSQGAGSISVSFESGPSTEADREQRAPAAAAQTQQEVLIKSVKVPPLVETVYKSRPPVVRRAASSAVENATASQTPFQPAAFLAAGSGPGQGGGSGGGSGGGTGPGIGSGFGPGVSRPGLVAAPKPPYPRSARAAGFEGKVGLEILVGKQGAVDQVKLLSSSGREDCDQAALSTIRDEWRFAPATFNGTPIDWREKVVVSYRLE